MATTILIEATTEAVISDSFSSINGNTLSMVAADLDGSETIAVEIYAAARDGSDKWINYVINSSQVAFSVNNPVVEIWQSGLTYRLNKPVTVNAVGVSLTQFLK